MDPTSTPTGMEALTTTLTGALGDVLPQITTAAGSVIGSIAPVALTIAGMVAVVGITISVFRRLARG